MKTGKIVIGSVEDCNKRTLERLLKNFDPQLYLKWNPEKNSGIGLWELRRRPNNKTAVPRWQVGNSIVFDLQYVESDWVHHVLDLPCLYYGVLDKLKAMDTWNSKDWVSDLEYAEDKDYEKELQRNKEELRYNIKQNKRAMKDFYEHFRSGRNPADFLVGDW